MVESAQTLSKRSVVESTLHACTAGPELLKIIYIFYHAHCWVLTKGLGGPLEDFSRLKKVAKKIQVRFVGPTSIRSRGYSYVAAREMPEQRGVAGILVGWANEKKQKFDDTQKLHTKDLLVRSPPTTTTYTLLLKA